MQTAKCREAKLGLFSQTKSMWNKIKPMSTLPK